MSFIFEPVIAGDDLQLNGWRWRAICQLLVDEREIAFERADRMCTNGIGTSVSAADSTRIADFLDRVLARLGADDRIGIDGIVTNKPRAPEDFQIRPDDAPSQHYHATASDVRLVRDFLQRSGGFKIL
jgi:hypothetical protein